MNLKSKLISVFTKGEQFLGNIAAVVELDKEIESTEMQEIAKDFNQPATSFFWKDKSGQSQSNCYRIRWFAPDAEIPLCGHGLAAATAYFIEKGEKSVSFQSKSGEVSGKKAGLGFQIALPKGKFESAIAPKGLAVALGVKIQEYYKTSDKDIVVLESEEELINMKPDFEALRKLEPFGYGVTALSSNADFASRTLVPKVQQLEDHATGSSHTVLVPFWAKRLGKKKLTALQHSPRGGAFICLLTAKSVEIQGEYNVL
jgi:PhzF family phenazine biosynthesis protein